MTIISNKEPFMPKAKCIVRIIKYSRPSNIRFKSTLRACKWHNWHKWSPLLSAGKK